MFIVNMKTLRNIFEGSLLADIEDTLEIGDTQVSHKLIQEYLEQNYNGKWRISKRPDKDGKYIVNSGGEIKTKCFINQKLTNDLFKWGKVKTFIITNPVNITTLEGAPKIVDVFRCSYADKLNDLTGAPEEITSSFIISHSNIKSLKGLPKKIYGSLYCNDCKYLKDLTGCPEYIGENFDVSGCNSLKSLNGAPKYVGHLFDCSECASLETLEGCPMDVLHFYCEKCEKLNSLNGAPKKIRGSFIAKKSGIKTLNSGIEDVGRNFSIEDCYNLKDLTGAPKLVRNTFDMSDCTSVTSLKGLENTEIGNDLIAVRCIGLNDIEDIIKYTPNVGYLFDMHFNRITSISNDQKIRLKKASGAEAINI